MTLLHSRNQTQAGRLNEELGRMSAMSFHGEQSFPEDAPPPQVLGMDLGSSVSRRPLEPWRTTAPEVSPALYAITPGWASFLEVTFAGTPLREMQPMPWVVGTRLILRLYTNWDLAQMVTQFAQFPGPVIRERTVHYKTGRHTLYSASVEAIPPDEALPVSVVRPASSINEASMQQPETLIILLATLGANDITHTPSAQRHYLPSGIFTYRAV